MVKVDLLHAFLPDVGEGGNPAGVVADASGLDADEMQRIASKVGVSETAFVLPATRATLKLRYFAPQGEVPLCGHATLAAFHALAEDGRFGVEDGIRRLTCETNAGVLAVDVHFEEGAPQKVVLTQAKPEILVPRLMVAEVTPHLGVDRPRIEKAGAPIQIVSTGARHVVVPVDTRETLRSVRPGPGLAAFLVAKKVHTLHVWTLVEARPRIRVAQRSFAPHFGIPEDPATGTATGAMAAYLLTNHLVDGNAPVTTIRAEQGVEMGKPSALTADVHVDAVMNGFRPTKVKVGGRSKRVGSVDV